MVKSISLRFLYIKILYFIRYRYKGVQDNNTYFIMSKSFVIGLVIYDELGGIESFSTRSVDNGLDVYDVVVPIVNKLEPTGKNFMVGVYNHMILEPVDEINYEGPVDVNAWLPYYFDGLYVEKHTTAMLQTAAPSLDVFYSEYSSSSYIDINSTSDLLSLLQDMGRIKRKAATKKYLLNAQPITLPNGTAYTSVI